VTTTQVTLIQIDNYGPWTVTPEPRREMDLQSLQSRLFADIAQFMGPRDAYVFSTRYDNMIAVTNGLDGAAHAALQESIGNRYPVSVSLGTGVSERPIDALEAANRLLQTEGSAQDESRTECARRRLPHRDGSVGPPDCPLRRGERDREVHRPPQRVRHVPQHRACLRLADAIPPRIPRRPLVFVGGDNVVAVCPDLPEGAFADTVAHVADDVDIELQVGVGRGASAHEAGFAAKHALEACRNDGTSVELSVAPALSD